MCILSSFLCTYNSKRGYICVLACLCIEPSGRTQKAGIKMALEEDLSGQGGFKRETCLLLYCTIELLVHAHIFIAQIIITFNTKYIILLGSMCIQSIKRSRYLYSFGVSHHRYLLITKRKITLQWRKQADPISIRLLDVVLLETGKTNYRCSLRG